MAQNVGTGGGKNLSVPLFRRALLDTPMWSVSNGGGGKIDVG
jgi:hypothetical protein